ncbi:MAG: hypothetical protein J7L73_00430 [Anaerolineales bacterium]|nr:hypothetical protein [Anaerolineales bacterium]
MYKKIYPTFPLIAASGFVPYVALLVTFTYNRNAYPRALAGSELARVCVE